jgi:NAD+ diphosphatase
VSTFRLTATPALSRTVVDRREPMRDDAQRLATLWSSARVLRLDPRSRAEMWPPTEQEPAQRPAWQSAARYGPVAPSHAVLLGEHKGTGYWAIPAGPDGGSGDGGTGADPAPVDGAEWVDLRLCGGMLADADAGLLTTAVALLSWHGRARFCARCGSAATPARAGWATICAACGHEEYPRTDPAVIVLVHDGADQVLLARQPTWPPGRYSVLAGFVEAGESLEACVRREVAEEVGVTVTDVGYLGSQPWPFPRSLMVGFAACADPDQPLIPAVGEIEGAQWVHRDRLRAALTSGTWTLRDGRGNPTGGTGPDSTGPDSTGPDSTGPGEEPLILPGGVSIARVMLDAWADPAR